MSDPRPALPAVDLDPPRRNRPFDQDVALMVDWCGHLFAPGQVVELRALDVPDGPKWTGPWNGYFTAGAADALVRAALRVPVAATGVHVTLNPLNPSLLARRGNRIAKCKKGDAATDADVLARRWLLVDVDSKRAANISATDEEKARAGQLVLAIRESLHAAGWPDPVVADSGNGFHLLYRIDLPADDGGLVKRTLETLANRFDTEYAHVDRAVGNPGRLVKLPGTWASKGDSTDDRPHRRGRILHVPADLAIVEPALLELLAAEAAPPAAPATVARAAVHSTATSGRRRRQPGRAAGNSGPGRLDVPRWLADRGVAFRVKDRPDQHGRTIYVLESCPFNSEHKKSDSCVMQDAAGKLSAKCFHSSCEGEGWAAFRDAIGKPESRHFDPATSPAGDPPADPPGTEPSNDSNAAGGEPGAPRGQRWIVVNGRQLPDVTADALAALADANDPPALFQYGGVLARVRPAEEGDDGDTCRIEPLTEAALRGVLARAATWYESHASDGGTEYFDTSPTRDVVRDVASLPRWPNVPAIRGVVEVPVFARDGELVRVPGYHGASRLWYAPAADLAVPDVPDDPTDGDLARARGLILDDLLGDFPFADGSGGAHAVAMFLLPFVRPMVDGPTPLHLFDAPAEGTGKTLLVQVLTRLVRGRDVPAIPEAENDAEWRKRITAALVEGRSILHLDNLNRAIDSGSLASALTAESWGDRLLGVSKMVQVKNRAVWIATGNNVALSPELMRRTLWCRLDARTERPSERTGFRHPRLLAWAAENRGRLVGAALTLVRAWLARGRPAGPQTLGMYESWVGTVGGILDVAGIPGLLDNRPAFRATQQAAADDWPAFLQAWWEVHGGRSVGTVALYDLALQGHLLDGVLGNAGTQSQRSRLGRALVRRVERIQGPYRVLLAEPDRCRRQQYRLENLDPAEARRAVAESIGH